MIFCISWFYHCFHTFSSSSSLITFLIEARSHPYSVHYNKWLLLCQLKNACELLSRLVLIILKSYFLLYWLWMIHLLVFIWSIRIIDIIYSWRLTIIWISDLYLNRWKRLLIIIFIHCYFFVSNNKYIIFFQLFLIIYIMNSFIIKLFSIYYNAL